MSDLRISIGRRAVAIAAMVLATSCHDSRPQTGSESHFLASCGGDDECGEMLTCRAGACTTPCESDALCRTLAAASTCLDADSPETRVCDVTCTAIDDCTLLGADFDCEAGRCRTGVGAEGDDASARDDPAADAGGDGATMPLSSGPSSPSATSSGQPGDGGSSDGGSSDGDSGDGAMDECNTVMAAKLVAGEESLGLGIRMSSFEWYEFFGAVPLQADDTLLFEFDIVPFSAMPTVVALDGFDGATEFGLSFQDGEVNGLVPYVGDAWNHVRAELDFGSMSYTLVVNGVPSGAIEFAFQSMPLVQAMRVNASDDVTTIGSIAWMSDVSLQRGASVLVEHSLGADERGADFTDAVSESSTLSIECAPYAK